MKVLVACEFSGIVRDALAKRGHDAWSCDLLPSETGGNHIQSDVLQILDGLPLCPFCNEVFTVKHNCYICPKCGHLVPLSGDFAIKKRWDLMIAHPPCTYFANSGLHYLKTQRGRRQKLDEAFAFVKQLWNAPIERICIENPIGWLNTNWYAPSQIIQPYYFGESEFKTTCLWLKNLPILMYTQILETPKPKGYCMRKTGVNTGKKYNYYWRQGKNAETRSRTFSGIAKAMAEQWGAH